MKRLIILGCILSIMLLCCACSEQEPNEEVTMEENLDNHNESNTDNGNSESNTENNNQKVDYSYGFTVNEFKDETGLNIPYDGEPINMSYTVKNEGPEFTGAILIFLSGETQEYTVKDSNKTGVIVPVDFPANKKTTVEFTFVPSYGSKGEVLPITFGCVLEADSRATSDTYSFGHAYSILPLANEFGNLHINNDVNGIKQPSQVETIKTPMPQEDIDKYVYTGSRGDAVNKLKENKIELLVNGEKCDGKIYTGNDSTSLDIRAFGGEPTEYAVTMLLNGVPLGTDAIYITADGKNYETAHVDIDFNRLDKDEYSIEEYNTLYVVACPVTYGEYEIPSKVMVASVSKEKKEADSKTDEESDKEVPDNNSNKEAINSEIIKGAKLVDDFEGKVISHYDEEKGVVVVYAGGGRYKVGQISNGVIDETSLKEVEIDRQPKMYVYEDNIVFTTKGTSVGKQLQQYDINKNELSKVVNIPDSRSLVEYNAGVGKYAAEGAIGKQIGIYDFEEGKEVDKIKIQDNRWISVLSMVKGDKGYAFYGLYERQKGKQGVPCFGLIGFDGKVTIKGDDRGDGEMFINGLVLYNEAGEMGYNEISKVAYLFDADSGEIKKMNVETTDSSNVHISSTGKYIVTETGVNDEGEPCKKKYDIFSGESGKLIDGIEVECVGEDLIHLIGIINESEGCLLFKHSQSEKVTYHKYYIEES